ncbi:ABC transporter ATP-binding protein [Sphaerisporangium krabiense]|uniref:ABC-2 type transport system ATP-binding protein n=1 Tax=Sphaerisporangium krabiense TaxID=763782 RepID=A0A7W9DRQ6_9ACTN|nr:ABC transporter ATP-binding protein [Sphaerisporangium krabiense]MBB5627610.1 ABC-2 type transport system ATP-binding protein [Sphaerisporangium krabiense]GII66624.1 ABC transporter ATP-binding protein [Sphaerisporangium krabiense]
MTANSVAAQSAVTDGGAVLRASGLGKRYRGVWALRDCSLSIPAGRVVALVGPNGAGKTTLIHMIVGLLAPTEGEVRVFGAATGRDRVAFVAQDKPLYNGFSVAETLRFGRTLNPGWDDAMARRRLADLDIPLRRKVGALSGGQRTQVALTIALAKRPDLLVLDEPLADLDPLARHDVTRGLMAAVAEHGTTVLFSSHVVSDLEGTCDWLVMLNRGRVQVSGDLDDLVASHRLLTGPAEAADEIAARLPVVARTMSGRQASLLVRDPAPPIDPRWSSHAIGLNDLIVTYLRDPRAGAPRDLSAVPAE